MALALLVVAAACGACDEPSRKPWGAAPRLERLDLTAVALLPAAAVEAPPDLTAPAFVERDPAIGALSIGPTHTGELIDGVAIEAGVGLAILPFAQERDAIFGTPAMVGLITRAAARVARMTPGSTLWIGDLSRARGGPFAPHASHQNGRDADLAFYLMAKDGTPADEPAMRAVDASGRVGAKRFDVVRNWALIEAMLEDPAAQVQWVFVASYLRTLLLERARAVGSPLASRAERILLEPRDSSPHADHFHVRIYCGPDDRLAGCLDAAPFHAWIDRHDELVTRWLDGLVPFLDNPHHPEVDHAIEAIVRMNATAALPRLDALADHPDPAIAALAKDGAAFLRGARSRQSWERWRPRDVGH